MEIGSEAHRELYCRSFIEGHEKYEPEDLPWPDLDAEAVEKLRRIPFWTPALEAEKTAGPMVGTAAAATEHPFVREAIELQGYEENRHARLIRYMLERYDIDYVEPPEPVIPADAESAFIDFGFEECLDSFGAFGIFALAKEAEFLPEGFFTIFNHIVQEEAHHIVFFLNWYGDLMVQKGRGTATQRNSRALWQYGKAVVRLIHFGLASDSDSNAAFTATGAKTFVSDLTPTLFLSTCVRENERRLAKFDSRLLRPRLGPALAKFGLAGLSLLPPYGRPPKQLAPSSNTSTR